jgi:para-aminobenzoate synthetase component 1
VAYDWGLMLERLPAPRYDDLALPDVVMAIYDWVLAWDHAQSRAWLISTGMPESSAAARASRAATRAAAVRRRLADASAPSHPRTLAPSHLRTLAPSHPRTLVPALNSSVLYSVTLQ